MPRLVGCIKLGGMESLLAQVQVVLVRPRFPENIGAAARAVANFGLGGLRVVAPQRLWEEPMRRLASRGGRPVLEAMVVCEELGEALGDCVAAFATTARRGSRRGRLLAPRRAAPLALEWAERGPVALVFGPEDRGLTTGEVDACQETICIPTAESSSLNLAQAVVVVAYELRLAALERAGREESASRVPRPASLQELEGLKAHLKQALVAMGVIPADNPDHFFRPFKNVLERAGLSAREVRALHGIARQALWLAGRRREG